MGARRPGRSCASFREPPSRCRPRWPGLRPPARCSANTGRSCCSRGLPSPRSPIRGAGAYLRSRAPWITIAVGLVALVPHLVWLYQQRVDICLRAGIASRHRLDVAAVGPELRRRRAAPMPPLPVLIAVVAAPTVARGAGRYALAARCPTGGLSSLHSRRRWCCRRSPPSRPQSLAVSLWSIGGLTLLPVVLLSSPSVTLSRSAVRRIRRSRDCRSVDALLASPIVAHRHSPSGSEQLRRSLSAGGAGGRTGLAATRPMRRCRFSAATTICSTAVRSIFRTPPRTFEIVSPDATPWTSEADVARSASRWCVPTIMRCA